MKMPKTDQCPPGSHPHADQSNWQPAETVDDYVQNCREGLETYSERRVCELLGWTRVQLWRARMMAKIPDDLFDKLLDTAEKSGKPISRRQLAIIGQVFSGGTPKWDVETCPCCGHVLRTRAPVPKHLADAILEHLNQGATPPSKNHSTGTVVTRDGFSHDT